MNSHEAAKGFIQLWAQARTSGTEHDYQAALKPISEYAQELRDDWYLAIITAVADYAIAYAQDHAETVGEPTIDAMLDRITIESTFADDADTTVYETARQATANRKANFAGRTALGLIQAFDRAGADNDLFNALAVPLRVGAITRHRLTDEDLIQALTQIGATGFQMLGQATGTDPQDHLARLNVGLIVGEPAE